MITFSAPFKDAFKMALAMVIAYAIALSQGWGTPFWAGFAVAFCGLTGVGESLNKGMLRVFGTLFGATMGLVLLFLTGPLAYMPEAVLSAVVFLIGLDLIDLDGMRRIYRERRSEFWVAPMAVLVGVEQGIRLVVAQVMDDVRDESRYQLDQLFGKDAFFETLQDVVDAYRKETGAR
jgi:uncharacterized membrane protein